jgi:hypothetical protein
VFAAVRGDMLYLYSDLTEVRTWRDIVYVETWYVLVNHCER